MELFLSLLMESMSCIFYGIIITAFIMVTLFFLLKNLSSGVYRSIPFYITGTVLALLLTINTTVIIGAVKIKGQTESMRIWLTQQLDGMEGIADVHSSQQIGTELNEQFPLLDCFFNLYDMSGNSISSLPQAFYETINREANQIILRKSIWSVGFIIAAILTALYFTKENVNTNSRTKRTHNRSRYKSLDDF